MLLKSLMQNKLRKKFNLHADGDMQSGKYVMLTATPGAENYGFGMSAIKHVSFKRFVDNA